MADLFSNFVSFLFFTTLFLSLQIINARESQFFSKVTHANNNNGEETDLLNEEETSKKPEQEPVFIPETGNSYGLYGHESSQFPPATATTTTMTYQPYKTESEEYMNRYLNNKYNSYYNKDAHGTHQNDFISKNNNYYKDAYGNDLDNKRYTEGGYESVSNQMRKHQKLYNSNNGASERYHNYRVRQGMSDTRFMEGGKYSYENSNSMGGSQNQEFEGDIENFQP